MVIDWQQWLDVAMFSMFTSKREADEIQAASSFFSQHRHGLY